MAQDKIINIEPKTKTPTKASISPVDELAIKTAKEIVIKFIEMGRCSPGTFEEVFIQVFSVIKKTLNNE